MNKNQFIVRVPGAEASHNSLRWATLKTSKDKRLRVMNVNLSRKDWMANYSRKQIKTENLLEYRYTARRNTVRMFKILTR